MNSQKYISLSRIDSFKCNFTSFCELKCIDCTLHAKFQFMANSDNTICHKDSLSFITIFSLKCKINFVNMPFPNDMQLIDHKKFLLNEIILQQNGLFGDKYPTVRTVEWLTISLTELFEIIQEDMESICYHIKQGQKNPINKVQFTQSM